jgi:homocysteine S-methyltransferase
MATIRISPIVYGSYIKEKLKVPIIPNLSCRDRNLLALQSELLGAHMLGFRDVFVITGDTPKKKENFKGVWEVHSNDLCRIIKGLNNGSAEDKGAKRKIEASTEFSVGGAIVINRHKEADYFNLKVENGFDFFITQITFEAQSVIDFLSNIPTYERPPIQVGLAPISSTKKLKVISKMPGINIPEKIKKRVSSSEDFESALISELAEVADSLRYDTSYPLGFHIMPIGSDELGCRLAKELIK